MAETAPGISTREAVIELAQSVGEVTGAVYHVREALEALLSEIEGVPNSSGLPRQLRRVREALARSEHDLTAAYERTVKTLRNMGGDGWPGSHSHAPAR